MRRHLPTTVRIVLSASRSVATTGTSLSIQPIHVFAMKTYVLVVSISVEQDLSK